MVLRGTKTRPDQVDLLDIQHHIARLKLLIDSLEEQESDVEQELKIVAEKEHEPINIDQLKAHQMEMPSNVSESIKVLIDRLEFLEKKQSSTKQELTEKQDELSIMIKQFVCGGVAGMTARTTVAPIDRVKLIIQTAMVRKNIEAGERGIIATARHEITKGGVLSMWKGMWTTSFSVHYHHSHCILFVYWAVPR